jgi:alkanesulfonate monooxygenase SsuD/methylene tetrahydromethanopterin reductase-like flavin-dependent oxidoreductase (luciferase family)
MKIGIALPNQVRDVRPVVIPEWASTAERAGFSTLGTVGRIAYPGVMDTVALAAAAGATSTIGLLSHVVLAPAWPPVLLAKEAASIDGVSGGRLTLGVGVGVRPDDFVADGHGLRDRGKRFDHDLEVYRGVWRGSPVGGGVNAAVPGGTREVPLLFGAMAPAAFERMARWGEGYIGMALPRQMVADTFESARAAWRNAGRAGSPRLVASAYFAFGDIDRARGNIHDYYAGLGEDVAHLAVSGIRCGAVAVQEAIREYTDLGADELIFSSGLDDVSELERLAEAVL